MSLSRRDAFKLTALGAVAAAGEFHLGELRAAAPTAKVGVTDWNLRLEAKLEAVDLAKKLTFDGIQISCGRGPERLQLGDPELQKQYVDAAARNNITINSTCLNILHVNYLKSDPLGRRWVAESIPITKAVKADLVLLPFFGKGALQTKQEMDFVGDVLKEIAPEAEKQGVTLALEDTISAEDNLRIMERSKSKAVQVYYDIGNSTSNGFDIFKEIRLLGKERICEIHLKDGNNLLGQGKIDMRRVAEVINSIGYSRWLVLETSSPRKNIELDMSYNVGFTRALFAQ